MKPCTWAAKSLKLRNENLLQLLEGFEENVSCLWGVKLVVLFILHFKRQMLVELFFEFPLELAYLILLGGQFFLKLHDESVQISSLALSSLSLL